MVPALLIQVIYWLALAGLLGALGHVHEMIKAFLSASVYKMGSRPIPSKMIWTALYPEGKSLIDEWKRESVNGVI